MVGAFVSPSLGLPSGWGPGLSLGCLLQPYLQSTARGQGRRARTVGGGDVACPHATSPLPAGATSELPSAQTPFPAARGGGAEPVDWGPSRVPQGA